MIPARYYERISCALIGELPARDEGYKLPFDLFTYQNPLHAQMLKMIKTGRKAEKKKHKIRLENTSGVSAGSINTFPISLMLQCTKCGATYKHLLKKCKGKRK